jgi:hypothetical protein
MGDSSLGSESERPLEASDRLAAAAVGEIGLTEVVVRCEGSRVQPNRPCQGRDSIRKLSGFRQKLAEIIERLDRFRLEPDDLVQQLDAERRPAGTPGNDAQQMECERIAGITGEDLAAEFLRLAKQPLLVGSEGRIEMLLNINHVMLILGRLGDQNAELAEPRLGTGASARSRCHRRLTRLPQAAGRVRAIRGGRLYNTNLM